MAILKNPKSKQQKRRSVLLIAIAAVAIGLVWVLLSSSISLSRFSFHLANLGENEESSKLERKYLYWGNRIDCPGKHCDSCEGLGHQESSLRCALEEALYLKRVFVMPSRMCINPIHNKKGILHHLTKTSSQERWAASSCAMDSLYNLELISKTIPVILDNSKMWFMECKDRTNHSSVMLPYSFLPMNAASKLRAAAEKIKGLLGDYDAIHVRRGDKIKTRKDRFGVVRSLHPHLDRDTRPQFIQHRIAKWISPGRTLFIASNERAPDFFSSLSVRYKLAYSSNYSSILDPMIENNYQLFMVERLILAGARIFVKTFKEYEDDLSLTDDPKKNTKNWQIPIYSLEEEGR